MSWGILNCADLEGRLFTCISKPAIICHAISGRKVKRRRASKIYTHDNEVSRDQLYKITAVSQHNIISEQQCSRLSVMNRITIHPLLGTTKVSRLGDVNKV